MEYVIAIGLTLVVSWSIIELNKYKVFRNLNNVRYSQSDKHQTILNLVPQKLNSKKEIESQSVKHAASTMIKIIVIDNKAYWIKDNIFYSAETDSGDIVEHTTNPVDVSSMSKKDIDKMLFILDNLRRGKENDSSSAGN
jgi:hypothetical protein